MYEGETEPIPRVTDRGESDLPEPPASGKPSGRPAHHHHHDHSPPLPASRRVRTVVAALLIPFALAAVVGTVLLFPFGDGPQTQGGAGRPVHGVITSAETGSCSGQVQVGEQPDVPQCLVVTVRMTDGEAPGQEIQTIVPLEPSTPRFAVDDEVVLSYGGSDPRESGSYQLVDFQRDVPLALLAGLFAVAVLVLGRWQGLKALAALGLSFLVLVFFVLPAILAGENPLLVAICGAGVIMFAVLYLTHGLSARTSTAVLGTMVSLAMIGVLGSLWAAFAKLTGLDEDTATLVGLLNAPIDTRGLLLAGVVIGALGVLDDVTVTQTSAMWELRAANPLLTRRELYTSALRIGRDHVASAVNTLVMAYAGAALPLLLYSSISGVGLGSILTSQSIAQELVRTLVGSIGLVAAVPITTALAAAVASQEPAPESVSRSRAPRGKDRTTERPERRPDRAGERGAGVAERGSPGHGTGRAPRRQGPEAQDGTRARGGRERPGGRTSDQPLDGGTARTPRRRDASDDRPPGRTASRKATQTAQNDWPDEGLEDQTSRRKTPRTPQGDWPDEGLDDQTGLRKATPKPQSDWPSERVADQPGHLRTTQSGQRGWPAEPRPEQTGHPGATPAPREKDWPGELPADQAGDRTAGPAPRRRDRLEEDAGRGREAGGVRQSPYVTGGAREWADGGQPRHNNTDRPSQDRGAGQDQRPWFEDDLE